MVLGAETGKDGRVEGGERNGEVEKTKLSDAGVGPDVPGTISLVEEVRKVSIFVGMRRRMKHGGLGKKEKSGCLTTSRIWGITRSVGMLL